MIRRTILLVLLLAGCATAALWAISLGEKTLERHGISVKRLLRVRLFYERAHKVGLAGSQVDAVDALWADFRDGQIRIGFEHQFSGPIKTVEWSKRLPSVFYIEMQEAHASYPPKRLGPNQRLMERFWTLFIHLWVVSVGFLAYPVTAFIRGPYRRYRCRKKGLCLRCSYNLTGNVSGVCPECGERI